MINYPNGKKFNGVKKEKTRKINSSLSTAANRGMNLENDINKSNEYYEINKIAFITKRPTPINIVKVDYSRGARIIDAYFEKQSTTDYNGVYKGRYIDFEAKSTMNKTSFPLSNIYIHQINHLENVIEAGGIAFFIIEFVTHGEIYLVDAKIIIDFFHNEERKSIPYIYIKEKCSLLKQALNPRIDYIDAVDKLYFNWFAIHIDNTIIAFRILAFANFSPVSN